MLLRLVATLGLSLTVCTDWKECRIGFFLLGVFFGGFFFGGFFRVFSWVFFFVFFSKRHKFVVPFSRPTTGSSAPPEAPVEK